MAAALDRATLFASLRLKPFGRGLTTDQVSGVEAILDACPPDLGTDALAYAFGTAFHETARTMLPVKEYGGDAYYFRMYDIAGQRPQVAKTLGNTAPGDGVRFCGRGYVQLTGRSNYRRATGELQNRGYLTLAQDLTVTPDLAMQPDVAAAILFIGMSEGWFTGRKLPDYFGPGKSIPVSARAIINGTDRAAIIAGYFRDFQAALVAAGHKPGAVASSLPVSPISTKPLPPIAPNTPVVTIGAGGIAPGVSPVLPAPKPGVGSRFGNWLASKLSLPWG